jgi:tetratricopeptide (TPR) repeat protein
MFAAVLIPRIQRVEDLRKLVSSLDALDTADRGRLLDGFKTDDGELRLLCNGPWAFMKREAQADYEDYAGALEDALSAGRRWGHHPWMRASARTLSAVLDEMLERREDAKRVVTSIAQEVGPSLNLDDQVASIAFNHKEYDVALAMWKRILPNWDADKRVGDLQPIFSMRWAAIAAAHLGKWDVAAEMFGQAVERSPTLGMKPWRIGLRGDRGYALWRSGDRRGAAVEFSRVVEALETLPNRPESVAEYAVQKLVGHALASLAEPESVAAVIPGMCSNLEPSEGIKELPPTPTVYAWFLVYELARQTGSDELAARSVEKFRDAPFATLRAMAARHALVGRLNSRHDQRVSQLAIAAALEMEKSLQRVGSALHESDPPGLTAQLSERSVRALIRPSLWLNIMQAKVRALSTTEVLANWQTEMSVAAPGLAAEVAVWDRHSKMSTDERSAIVKNDGRSWEERTLAAVLMLGSEESPIEDIVYAQVILIDGSREHELLREVSGESFDALVRRDWLRFCENPFMLRSPQLYVSAIREACESSVVGWQAAARIILTALPTASIRVPERILTRLGAMATGL